MTDQPSHAATISEEAPTASGAAYPRVAIIVLNWNGWEDTLGCLESLGRLRYPSFRTIVVDNGSTNDSLTKIEAWKAGHPGAPGLTVLETGENLGFAGGNNAGIRHALKAGFDYVWLLNNDTVADPQSLLELVRAAESDSRIAVTGSLILYQRSPGMINSAGIRISRFGRARLLGLNRPKSEPKFNVPREVDAVSGCSMLLRCSALRAVGLMDERYFLYLEEIDLCTRLRQAGYRCWVAPESIVFHKQWGSIQPYPELADYYLSRSQVLYIKKFYSGFQAVLDYALFIGRYFPGVILRSRRIRNFDCYRAFKIGLRHGFAGRFDYRWRGRASPEADAVRRQDRSLRTSPPAVKEDECL